MMLRHKSQIAFFATTIVTTSANTSFIIGLATGSLSIASYL
jgi:hypothetical protein